jgi:hypothetical protein
MTFLYDYGDEVAFRVEVVETAQLSPEPLSRGSSAGSAKLPPE